MNKPTGWRVAVTLAVLLGSIAAYYWRGLEALKRSPTAPPNPSVSDVLKNGVKLGLDLKGGIHLVMQVKTGDAVKIEAQDAIDHLKEEAAKRGVALGSFPPSDSEGFTIALTDKTEPSKLKDLVKTALSNDWTIAERGREWRVTLKDAARIATEDLAVRQAVETIENRVNALGVTEPLVARQGTDRIIVQLPGVDDPSRVKDIIGQTGLLELKLVDDKGGPFSSEEAARQSYGGTIPTNELEVVTGYSEDDQAHTRTTNYYVLKRVAVVTGRDLKNARVASDKFGQPAVEFFLNAEGARKFEKSTGDNVGKHLAIVLDRTVMSAPSINSKIGANGIIEGNFTPERADSLSLVLRSGALPAELVILEERTVGPSLGLDSIRQGVLASVVGMLLVFAAVTIYYRLAGVNAVVALILNALLLLGAMSWINATLTLPGIAGFILTIGMAVDSNVLIFERIREEMEEGKPPRQAIDLGFKRAFATIIDTHLTTIASALFLFQFGTGPVKGFAVTLVLGLVISVFTSVFVSRLIFDLVYGSKPRVETISI